MTKGTVNWMVAFGATLAMAAGVVIAIGAGRMIGRRQVYTCDLSLGQTIDSGLLQVEIRNPFQIAVFANVTTPTYVTDGQEVDPQFRFPVEYEVYGASGTTIIKHDGELAWDTGEKRNQVVSGDRLEWSIRFEATLARVTLEKPEDMGVKIKVRPDTQYNAVATTMTLRVYDNARPYLFHFILGSLLIVPGVVMLINGFRLSRK